MSPETTIGTFLESKPQVQRWAAKENASPVDVLSAIVDLFTDIAENDGRKFDEVMIGAGMTA